MNAEFLDPQLPQWAKNWIPVFSGTSKVHPSAQSHMNVTNLDFPEIAGGFFPFPKKLLRKIGGKIGRLCFRSHLPLSGNGELPSGFSGGIGG